MNRILRLHPALWFVFGLSVFYRGLDAVLSVQFRQMGVRQWPRETVIDLRTEHLIVLCFFAFFYGGWRAGAFHPLSHKGYLDWLRSTPWHAGMPLPMGPVAFAWWDGIAVAAVTVLCGWHAKTSAALPLIAMSASYLVIALGLSVGTHTTGAFAITMCMGLSLPFIHSWKTAAAVSTSLAVLANLSVLRGLRNFPWEKDPATKPPELAGWLDMIPPNCAPLIANRQAFAVCLMLGCWSWSLLSLLQQHGTSSRELLFAVLMIAAAGASVRCIAYCTRFHPPLTIVGRLLTGKILIPRYDYVFAAPLLGVAAGWVIPRILVGLHLPLAVSGALGIAACAAILLMAPPTLRVWELTGFHRRVSFARNAPRRGRASSAEGRLNWAKIQ